MPSVCISDPTLRDGNHAARHQLSLKQIALYAEAADHAGVPIVEVGHGNGLGASSLQLGKCPHTDRQMLETARKALRNAKLGIHVIPGFATINKDLAQAIDIGVDVVRIASHCTEADITQRHLAYVRERGKTAYGVLMMSHMAPDDVLLQECAKLQSYGAEAVILMDSAGASVPDDVTARVSLLTSELDIPVGFHGHNNLGLAIGNSIAAVRAGATIIDATARGFGAGAGNTQLEVLVAVFQKLGIETGIDLRAILDAADMAEKELMDKVPTINSTSVVSGLSGVFSGFAKPVERAAAQYGVHPFDIFHELGRRKVVAGQEDLIIETAMQIAKNAPTPHRADL